MIDRRSFVNALALSLLGAPSMAAAQTAQRLPVVGVLTSSPNAGVGSFPRLVEGLRELGYVEGKNFTLEFRSAAFTPRAFPGYAAELVARKVDVIYAQGPAAINAAREATRTIPIVAYDLESDPVQAIEPKDGKRSGSARAASSTVSFALAERSCWPAPMPPVNVERPGPDHQDHLSSLAPSSSIADWKGADHLPLIVGWRLVARGGRMAGCAPRVGYLICGRFFRWHNGCLLEEAR